MLKGKRTVSVRVTESEQFTSNLIISCLLLVFIIKCDQGPQGLRQRHSLGLELIKSAR